jgi:hypothetical protein
MPAIGTNRSCTGQCLGARVSRSCSGSQSAPGCARVSAPGRRDRSCARSLLNSGRQLIASVGGAWPPVHGAPEPVELPQGHGLHGQQSTINGFIPASLPACPVCSSLPEEMGRGPFMRVSIMVRPQNPRQAGGDAHCSPPGRMPQHTNTQDAAVAPGEGPGKGACDLPAALHPAVPGCMHAALLNCLYTGPRAPGRTRTAACLPPSLS